MSEEHKAKPRPKRKKSQKRSNHPRGGKRRKGKHQQTTTPAKTTLSMEDFEARPFGNFSLSKEMLCATSRMGFTVPTPIQEKVIPMTLAKKDVVGLAQTGTGKTAAFLIPLIELHGRNGTRKSKRPGILVLAPTRELALQVEEHSRELSVFLDFESTAILGGVSLHGQMQVLARGVDLIVATPGRLLDLMGRHSLYLDEVHTLVIDEADRMFDMGFLPDVTRILNSLPRKRQTLLFSATMPLAIQNLCQKALREPEHAEIEHGRIPEGVEQFLFEVLGQNKQKLLAYLLKKEKMPSVLIFKRTKRGVDSLYQHLIKEGFSVAKVHGDLTQQKRQQALDQFKSGKRQILIATDLASRGLDIVGISHVINCDVPEVPEDYLHRVGRTARAECTGYAYTFASLLEDELVKRIERFLGERIKRRFEKDFCFPPPIEPVKRTSRRSKAPSRRKLRRR
ncbi:DEAD/DEAH box helicase [Planctomycetota bacterium]